MAPSSVPISAMVMPRSDALSRSTRTTTCGLSKFMSELAKMNRPDWRARLSSSWETSYSGRASSVVPMTNCTGRPPLEPGSTGGSNATESMPAMPLTFCWIMFLSSPELCSRSLQGAKASPVIAVLAFGGPPNVTPLNWNTRSTCSIDMPISVTWSVNSSVWSSEAVGAPSDFTSTKPWSSSGASCDFEVWYRKKQLTSTTAPITSTTGRVSSAPCSRRSYQFWKRSKARSRNASSRPCSSPWPCPFRTLEHIIGDRVSATMPEMITAPASEKANSENSVPVRPPTKPMGANTASSVMVIAMIGPPSSRAPLSDASIGDMPSSMCRWMFSTTMMASSTTSPIASTIASSVSRLIE